MTGKQWITVLATTGMLTGIMSGIQAELSPAGEAMIAIRAAKAVKKRHQQQEQQQADEQKLQKLEERYPEDVKEYRKLKLDSNKPTAAAAKLKDMEIKYYKDTGIDLEKEYAVKPQEGRIKKLLHNADADGNPHSTATPATSELKTESKPAAPVSTETKPVAATEAKAASAAPIATETKPASTETKPVAKPAESHDSDNQPGRFRRLLRRGVQDVRGEIREERNSVEKSVGL